ncbi:MAG: 16S rRNA (cytosine(967)-C(5))-methyltransferase RsmB [Desulfobacterales bacterium]|jgi:16S rRNA (cytosine967-C5)-methyltransferase
MSTNPRHLALEVLNRLERTGILLDPLLEEVLADADFKDPRDRTLFHALVFGTLRWRGRLDWGIGRFSKIPPAKIEPAVMNILRLGLYQAVFLDRIPVSAAVNTAVELAKRTSAAHVAGFVNAVLRNAVRNWGKVPLPDPKHDPAKHLAVRFSLPRWLTGRWLDRLGPDESEALCRTINEIPPISARVNTLLTDRPRLIETLEKECREVATGSVSPDAVLFRSPAVSVPELESHRKGWFQVQDEAAQLVVRLLDPQPGERLLDACAGLGGKTGHIAQRMGDKGRIVAAEKEIQKLDRLAAEMRRLSVSAVEPVAADLLAPSGPFAEPFDRILLDAPCSGLGVLRRNPDARWRTEKNDLDRYADVQRRLLSRTSRWLRPGGRLVYTVCTTEPEETEAVVAAFLRANTDFSVETGPKHDPVVSALIDARGFFHTEPHRHGTDGFFAVALTRDRGSFPGKQEA